MKAILISIKPQWVAKILNGEKTIEIRKRFPKDYVGWVYIYCTKDKKYANLINRGGFLTGMVVARFWCDKVENIIFGTTLYNDLGFFTGDLYSFDLYKQSCLTKKEMHNYLKIKPNGLSGYAIHITKLEIFDKPKEISDFYKAPDKKYAKWCRENSVHGLCIIQSLTRAPQSWCYVEVVR